MNMKANTGIVPEAASGQVVEVVSGQGAEPMIGGAARAEYVTDTEYTWGFYGDMAPLHLAYIALVNGVIPPDIRRRFTYLELGCGNGLSLNIFAASYPQGEFHAVDLNERHVQNVRQTAHDGGLDNVHVHHSSFSDLDLAGIPDMDFVVLHGVYSWVGPDIRRSIRDIVRRKLKPGGIVYISYNSLPGWASRLPLREIMLSYADNRGLNSIQMAQEGMKYLKFLTEKNALFFHDNPAARSTVEMMVQHDIRYLPHEYFNAHWDCFYCEDVIKEFSQVGCQFMGCAPLMMNIRDLTIPLPFHEVFKTAPDRIVYETHKSYVLNEGFRRDLFVRLPYDSLQQSTIQDAFDRYYFAILDPNRELQFQHNFFSGQVTFNSAVYQHLGEVLRQKSYRLSELRAHPKLSAVDVQTLIFALNVLICSNQCHLMTAPLEDPITLTSTVALQPLFSRSLLNTRLTQDQAIPLPSQILGTGVLVNSINGLALMAFDQHVAGESPEEWAQAFLAKHGRFVNTQEKKIEGKDEVIALLKDRFAQFRNAELLGLSRLGIVRSIGTQT